MFIFKALVEVRLLTDQRDVSVTCLSLFVKLFDMKPKTKVKNIGPLVNYLFSNPVCHDVDYTECLIVIKCILYVQIIKIYFYIFHYGLFHFYW